MHCKRTFDVVFVLIFFSSWNSPAGTSASRERARQSSAFSSTLLPLRTRVSQIRSLAASFWRTWLN